MGVVKISAVVREYRASTSSTMLSTLGRYADSGSAAGCFAGSGRVSSGEDMFSFTRSLKSVQVDDCSQKLTFTSVNGF